MTAISKERAGANMCAFLDTLSHSEGTDRYPNNGYNTIVGGAQFSNFADHPRIKVWIDRIHDYSTAAGRYQLMARYFDPYKKLLRLTDFSPLSQDLIAIQQIKEQHATQLILDGNIEAAIHACSNIWASLPGAGYGQYENKMSKLLDFYKGVLS